MPRKQTGFTIVELLIVIVVIGILAAITIVAYNGIQNRANDMRRISDVSSIAKALSIWTVDEGNNLPTSGAGSGGMTMGWFSRTISNLGDSTAPSSGTAEYTNLSIRDLLSQVSPSTKGIKDPASGSRSGDYMLSFCTTASDGRRVILARLVIPPKETIAEQIAGENCTHPYIDAWSTDYGMNHAVVAGKP